MKRLLYLFVAALAAAAFAVPAAFADGSGVASTLVVKDAQQTGPCVAGTQAYRVDATLQLTNNDTLPATVTGADWAAKGSSSSGDFSNAATATTDVALVGSTVPPGASRGFDVIANTTVPCDATSAQLCVTVTYLEGTGTQGSCSACAPFITNGTVVPSGTIGLLGLTLLLGVGLVVVQVRSRRRRRLKTVDLS
jgi:hypothetical protein